MVASLEKSFFIFLVVTTNISCQNNLRNSEIKLPSNEDDSKIENLMKKDILLNDSKLSSNDSETLSKEISQLYQNEYPEVLLKENSQKFLKQNPELLINESSELSNHNDDDDDESDESSEEESNIYFIHPNENLEERRLNKNISAIPDSIVRKKTKKKKKKSALKAAIQTAALQGLNAMIDLYERKEPEILRKGEFLDKNHPASILSHFSVSIVNDSNSDAKAAYASLYAAKKLQESINFDFTGLGRQSQKKKVSLRKTPLEGLCPQRDPPQCVPATKRYRTHDGTCNNFRKSRWGSAHMPFHRFLSPEYSDGLEEIRGSVSGGQLPSARFVSLVVHGYRQEESQVTMLLLQWGQLVDHDLTATQRTGAINGSIPKCCNSQETHPSCLPIKVPRDDPFLARLGVRCFEFLRSAPAQRRDCFLSWREQTNQVTSYIDASAVYSSNPRTADSSRIQRNGLLLFGRGPPREDICLHGGFGHQCIRAGDARAGEQPGLLALHTVFVAEHNRIALDLADLNPHWSDEKLYQETRRIIGAMFQHITYREFLPLVLGREVSRLFDLELKTTGYYDGYDSKVNPTIANSFSAAAFRFGHAMVQSTILRSDINFRFINNNVSLHEENSQGDIGGSGSLHRIIRGLASQRTLKRDEFMSPELTNHLFQSSPFPFGMDLAAINVQRGRDHGLPSYVSWREPCGLSSINSWEDLEIVAGVNSANRMRRAYTNVDDIDLFVGGISERPVRGGLVGPTFACIIAQQFSNLRRGDRFWYENFGFESSFTPAQLSSLRQVSLSQILCRSLGSSNFLQPHAFLPTEFEGNDRIRCGSGILSPINIVPWLERDPFHKENDFVATNVIGPQLELLMTDKIKESETSNPIQNDFPQSSSILTLADFTSSHSLRPNISHNIDFGNEVLLITARPPTTTRKTKTTVNNKIDFTTSPPTPVTLTTKRKRKTTTRTKLPSSTIDNRIDFTLTTTKTTKRPFDSPFSKLGRDSNKTTAKRSTDNFRNRNKFYDKLEHRGDSIDLTADLTPNMTIDISHRQFRNEDNATKYLDNKAITLQSDSNRTENIESRVNHNFYGSNEMIKQYDNYYYYGDNKPDNYNVQRPNNYYPLYPPLTQPPTSKRPTSFENNRPNFNGIYTKPIHPDPKPVVSPISNKLSTPFSYDTYNSPQKGPSFSSISPQINYDNMAIPLFVSPNRGGNNANRPFIQNFHNRQSYTTTRKMDLSTFLIVETTRRTSPGPHYYIDVERTTLRPYGRPLSHAIYPSLSISSIASNSNYNNNDPTNLSVFFSNTNRKFSTKKPHKPYSDSSEEDFDGYLRPENNFYIPLANNKHQISYNDYNRYDNKYDTTTSHSIKYVFKKNVLHKYHTVKSNRPKEGLDENEDEGVKEQTKRYAENYDKPFIDEHKDDTLTFTETDNDNKREDMTRTVSIDGRSKNGNTFAQTLLVPFTVLTSIERDNNWVNVNNDDENSKVKLPEVPSLVQDGNFARELPRPFRKVTKKIPQLNTNK